MNDPRTRLNQLVENHTNKMFKHANLIASISQEMQDLAKHDKVVMARLGQLLKDLSLELNEGIKQGIAYNRDFSKLLNLQESELQKIKAG